MRLFMTGGTGFIGSHIVLALLANGHEVTVLARNRSRISAFQSMPNLTVIEGELEFEILREALPGHQACIHNAVIWDEPGTELELRDTRAAIRVFQAASESGVEQMIYTSSTAVHRPFQPVMDEGQRLETNDFYGATKAAGEAFLWAFSHQTNMRCNAIRPGPTFGNPALEGAPIVVNRIIEGIVQSALAGEDIEVPAGARQFISAPDVAKVYVALLESSVNRQAFIAVARDLVSWESIAQWVVEAGGTSSQILTKEEPTLPFRFDVSRIEEQFGLAFDCAAGLQEHLRYLARRPQG